MLNLPGTTWGRVPGAFKWTTLAVLIVGSCFHDASSRSTSAGRFGLQQASKQKLQSRGPKGSSRHLHFNASGMFKIVQLSDLHLGLGPELDSKTLQVCAQRGRLCRCRDGGGGGDLEGLPAVLVCCGGVMNAAGGRDRTGRPRWQWRGRRSVQFGVGPMMMTRMVKLVAMTTMSMWRGGEAARW